MSEETTTAVAKHACAACGAQAEWHPGKQRLICPYCFTESPFEVDPESGEVREIDLVRTLREMPEELRGWQAEKRSVRCRSCKAISVFDAARAGQNCDFCGSPELLDYDEIKAPIRPLSLLPFKLDEIRVRERIRRWLGARWFAPSKLKKKALVDTVSGVYLPYWTFDSRAHCPWTAEAGHYYYTTESYTDGSGRRKTRRKRHVRWEPAAGVVEHFFDDQPVPGSQGIPHKLLRQIEPFPTNDLVPYDTAYLSGFVVEHYQVVLFDAAQAARDAMDVALRAMCSRQVPGDTQRNLRIAPEHTQQTYKHILVPVWLLSYDFRGKAYQLLVNGQTGEMAGSYPKSGWKIFFAVLAAVAAIGLVVLLASR